MNARLKELAVKGILAEISEVEESIKKGEHYLATFANGENPGIPKTENEVKEIVQAKRVELDKLLNEKFEIEWNY